MLKKVIKLFVILITLFYFDINIVNAYEFQNPENSSAINDMIEEIYDAKEQYEDLAGGYTDDVTIYDANSTSYWWPIGSSETTEINGKIFAKGDPETVRITSPFGYRKDPFGSGKTTYHSGLDIAGGSGLNSVNIIAAREGIVVYPTANVKNDCPSGSSQSSCGGGLGNYVVIQHSDGNYTIYGHMYEGSILVKAGDSVEQGQVIGKMGSSGNSTGAHLHFMVREGQNISSATVDPLNYVSPDEPRRSIAEGDFLSWLNGWEGHTKIDGNYYIVEDIGDGVRTVGGGVTLENNVSKFLEYGINVDNYPVGSKIPINTVDRIESEIVNEKRTYIENVLSNNSITLAENQIQALISQMYNCGNINGFVDAYKRYGNTEEFYNAWFFRNVMVGTKFEVGLTRRRNSEWTLFHIGQYVYNG